MSGRSWLLLCFCAVFSSREAAAQSSLTPSAPGASLFSSGAPLDVSAHSQNGASHIILDGEVEILQAQSRLRSPHVEIFTITTQGHNDPGTIGKVDHAEAQGPVYYATPTQQARGDHGFYTGADETIKLSGHVVLLQGENVTTGDQLLINQKTGVATLSSTGKERTRGVFYPQKEK